MRAHSSSQRSQGERPTVLPPAAAVAAWFDASDAGVARGTVRRRDPSPASAARGVPGIRSTEAIRPSLGWQQDARLGIDRPAVDRALLRSVAGCRSVAARPPAASARWPGVARTAFVVRGLRAQRGHGRQYARASRRADRQRPIGRRRARQDVADGQRPAVSAASRPGPWIPGRGRPALPHPLAHRTRRPTA